VDLLPLTQQLGIEGFLHPAEMEELVHLGINRDVLEIGSFKGLSSYCLALSAKSLLCVDTFRANSAGQVQEDQLTTIDQFRKNTDRFKNVSCIIGTSEETERIVDRSFDLIFLDAMHTYEDVKNDIGRWWKHLRANGIMAFHDYGHDHFPGVKQAVDEVFGSQIATVTLTWVYKK
jgi:predicted O-methyltransferase YrrM